MADFTAALPILIPLLIIELGMRIYAFFLIRRGMKREEKFSFEPMVWMFIVLLINFGWVFFLIFGKKDE